MPNTEDRISQREMEMLAQQADPRYTNQVDPRYAKVASHVSTKRPLDLVLESIKTRLNKIENELLASRERNHKYMQTQLGYASPLAQPTRNNVGLELAYRIDEMHNEKLQMERDKLVLAYAILSTNENIA